MKRKISVLLVILFLAAVMSGCDGEVPFLGNEDEDKPKTVSRDIYIPIEKVRTLNPVNSKDEDTYYMSGLYYDGLFRLDEGLSAVPDLASGYTFSEDGSSVTISLKSGITWHDGNSFSASDVKYSIDAYKAAGENSLYAPYVSNIKSAQVINDNSVSISFNDTGKINLEYLTFPILPGHQYKSAGALVSASDDFHPIGTGAYYVNDMDLGNEITLYGFDGYRGDTPTNNIHFKVMPDKTEAANLFDVNDLTITIMKQIERDTIVSSSKVNMTSFLSNEVEFLGFNFSNPVLADHRVRKGIAHAIDTEFIVDSAYYKSGVTNGNIYYPGYMGVNSKDLHTVSVELGKEFLSEAGFIDRNEDGILENEDGIDLSLTILVNEDDQSRMAAALAIQQNLEKLGIQTTINSLPWDSYNSALANGNFDLWIGGYRIAENYDMRFLLHSAYGNPISYGSESLDVLLDRMHTGITTEEKQKTYGEIANLLDKDLPYYCLLYKTYGAAASNGLKGDVNPYFFNVYNGCEDWTFEY